jgi:vesicle transport through interaction with t-SNAREs 1
MTLGRPQSPYNTNEPFPIDRDRASSSVDPFISFNSLERTAIAQVQLSDNMASSTGEGTFERYHQEYQELLQQIQQSLDSTSSTNPYTANYIQQADDLLKQMAVEARSIPDAVVKRTLLDQVRTFKSQLAALQTQATKRSLFNGNGNSSQGDQNKLLLQKNQDLLMQQNDTLERAKRSILETEQVALDITEELANNRETLMSAHGRVREVSTLTGRAQRVLSSMNQRQVQQKLLMYAITVGLVLAFFVLLYFVWG